MCYHIIEEDDTLWKIEPKINITQTQLRVILNCLSIVWCALEDLNELQPGKQPDITWYCLDYDLNTYYYNNKNKDRHDNAESVSSFHSPAHF